MNNFEQIAGILRCPASKEPLLYTADNQTIAKFFPGREVPVSEGYTNRSNTRFYPIVEGVICLLPQESAGALHENVKGVKAFYEEFGWKKDEAGRYHDSALFIEQKTAAEEYYISTMQRTARFLEPQGRYLLDVASGPVFQPENQALSATFEKRICVDITFRALLEARRNIGDEKGIFIQGDITNLPLADGVCDNAMSVHTLYHVPQELQQTAVTELARVCKPGSNVVILYNWAWHSWLMNMLLLPIRIVKAFKRVYRYLTVPAAERWLSGGLYFYPHPPAWFEHLGKQLGLRVSFASLTSVHQDFVKYYVHDGFGGASLLRWVKRMEERYPAYLGRHGAFGFIVMKKEK
jgi:ubiquinone/menaquinone biosynthesis C-methylase UbiE/uncharacterized protein YbaR (Trm112 family)